MDVNDACAEIHNTLYELSSHDSPRNVPFKNGLYFFYQAREVSPHAAQGRIVRIGNHPRSQDGLIRRLNNHYSGSKNGSVFRKSLGGALIRRRDPNSSCLLPGPGKGHWEKQDAKVCEECRDIEIMVSDLIRTEFWFRCVRIEDREERNGFERILISTLAKCSICSPSSGWLGKWAYSEKIRSSGLWNSDYVDDSEVMNEYLLKRFRQFVENSIK